jgi:hypothetical protein
LVTLPVSGNCGICDATSGAAPLENLEDLARNIALERSSRELDLRLDCLHGSAGVDETERSRRSCLSGVPGATTADGSWC